MDKQQRLHELLQYLRYIGKVSSQKQLADSIEMNTSTMSKAMNGDPKSLTDNLFKRIAVRFPGIFSYDWLLTGKGEMLAEKPRISRQNVSDGQTPTDDPKTQQKSTDAPVGPIIELYARLIQNVEAELSEVRTMQQQLADERAHLSAAVTSFNAAVVSLRSISARLTGYFDDGGLMAAEPSHDAPRLNSDAPAPTSDAKTIEVHSNEKPASKTESTIRPSDGKSANSLSCASPPSN